MRAIWKYPITILDRTGRAIIDVAPGSEPISVGVQGREIVVWCMIDPGYSEEARWSRGKIELKLVNTGTHFDETKLGRFLGTVTVPGFETTEVVWHVFIVNR